MSLTLYHYPRCSTCVKAKKWLDTQGVTYKAINLAEDPPSAQVLRELHESSGQALKKLFNTSGQSYRNGGFKDRLSEMSEEEQLSALSHDGLLIKRPLLVTRTKTLIGFKVLEWENSVD